jgi:hypothetical protein
MRCFAIVFWSLVFANLITAQQTSIVNPSSASSAQDSERAQIEALLKKYEDANNRRDLEALVGIWPDLPNQPKEFKKAQWHLKDDPDVFSENLTLEPIDWQIGNDQATVKCKRSEVWVKLQSRSEIGVGDLRTITGQLPDPSPALSKKVGKRNDNVTLSLQKQTDHWVIVSLSAKK